MNAMMKNLLESELAEMEREMESKCIIERYTNSYLAFVEEMDNALMFDFALFDYKVSEEEHDKVFECEVVFASNKHGKALTEKEKHIRHRKASRIEKCKKRSDSHWGYYSNGTAKDCKKKNHRAVRHSDVPKGKGNHSHKIASFEYFM